MRSSIPILPVVGALAFIAGCGVDNRIDWGDQVTGMVVDIQAVGGADFSPDGAILPVPPSGAANGIEIVLDVSALAAGEQLETLPQDMWVRLSSRPGKLQVLDAEKFFGNDVFLSAGHAGDVKVKVWDVYGPTRIWAEDVGFKPRTVVGSTAQCGDGKDNDGDGYADYPDDPGCLTAGDDSEESGSGAAGISQVVEFDTPTLAELQGFYPGYTDGFRGASPYSGEGVTVDKGQLIVTHVTTDGMYVTDVSDTSGKGYNHLYVFTYNSPTTVPVCNEDEQDSLNCKNDDKPIPLKICDRLSYVGGAVSEFYGFTEVSFPVWNTVLWNPDEGDCPVPEPKELAAADFRGSGIQLEGYEAALVRISDVVLGTAEDMVDCDFNKDGSVDFRDYDTNECSDECVCREACNDDLLCVEYNQYIEYGQWPARLGGETGVKVWVSSRGSVPEFDPWGESVPRNVVAITGTLRNLSFLDPYAWIIEPRCVQDIVLSGEPLPASQACVSTRDGE
jgi:hypothetical protein